MISSEPWNESTHHHTLECHAKIWVAVFEGKVTVRAYIVWIWMFLLHLLNCFSFCNQTYFDGTSSKTECLVKNYWSALFMVKVFLSCKNYWSALFMVKVFLSCKKYWSALFMVKVFYRYIYVDIFSHFSLSTGQVHLQRGEDAQPWRLQSEDVSRWGSDMGRGVQRLATKNSGDAGSAATPGAT